MISDQALIMRLETNEAESSADYARAMQILRPALGAQAVPIAGGYAVMMGSSFPANTAVGLGLHGPVSADELAQVEAVYAAAGLPAAVGLSPYADDSLRALLGERGYRIERFLHTFARPVHPAETFAPAPAGIEMSVLTPPDPEEWATHAACIFSDVAEVETEDRWRILSLAAAHRPAMTGWIARVDGVIVAVAGLAIRNGLASMFSMATRPAFRGRGIQTALLQARLQAAQAAGCDLATVVTVPGANSQRNVERAGFQVIYTKPTLSRTV